MSPLAPEGGSSLTDSPSNVGEFTVSQISFAVKRTVEDAFGYVRVRGEISGFRGRHSSGHAYFALKDEKARIEAVIWRGAFSKLGFLPEEGLEVIASGKLTTYPGSSKYQIVIDRLEPAGVGALMALLEERRKKLAAEGLFDAERKKRLPYLPKVIGVVTSPTGAVIRDILHRLDDRFPVRVVVWPVRVQGETSAAEVAAAIRGFNALAPGGKVPRPDILIVARGGGSLEDLWGFNEEVVVRAASESEIPLISAVGHETDTTLIDHVADLRAPTPTGAAEMAVPVRSELLAAIDDLSRRHFAGLIRYLDGRRRELRALARVLPKPEDLVAVPRQRFDVAAGRLGRALGANTHAHATRYARVSSRLSFGLVQRALETRRRDLDRAAERRGHALTLALNRHRARFDARAGRLRPGLVAARAADARKALTNTERQFGAALLLRLERGRARFAATAKLMESLSYKRVLARGFAVLRDADNVPVSKAAAISGGDMLDIELADGHVAAVAGEGKPTPKKKPTKPTPEKTKKPDQGQLF
ncbi:exodeoxyribonuclease VII large subunit [Rhodobium orientis]|uniref:Exodeoxyribonuclease 7 large subunit n=1 Tax=Rhodobium orientis TaxID=34017 RepID=A0A327JGU3_9HYPH|nr:exodeoxyribonuclease VII large subunit [Rhodobium orientis]MBK5948628.1 exodeoxyribonuclease VII large subunit [Rhodobium orientis]RAI24896.1 exodeoxyribonuclease VII large subunit [Rhodobium orientis]